MTTQPDYYAFLGVPRDATTAQIEQAFRAWSLKMHPDKVKGNPQAERDFVMLTKIYQVLIDPRRRKQYDATLPPPAPSWTDLQDLPALWREVGRVYLERSERFTPAIDAVRLSAPITLEGDLLVVGIEPTKSNLVGYLNAVEARSTVKAILRELTQRQLDFCLISGTTMAEWTTIRAAEEHRRAKSAGKKAVEVSPLITERAQTASSTPAAASADWEEILRGLMAAWGELDDRTLPQVRARFVLDQLPYLARCETMAQSAGIPDGEIKRGLARILERVASLSGMESGVVALEYLRYRRLLGG